MRPGGAGGSSGELPLCTAWDVCLVIDPAAPNGRCVAPSVAKAVRLRFTSAEENVGDGPLLLYGRRDSTKQETMTVRQALRNGADGSIPGSYAAAQYRNGGMASSTATLLFAPDPQDFFDQSHLMDRLTGEQKHAVDDFLTQQAKAAKERTKAGESLASLTRSTSSGGTVPPSSSRWRRSRSSA